MGPSQSMRLPILSDAGGFGTLPQMFFAFDGDASTLSVPQGELRIGERLQSDIRNQQWLHQSIRFVPIRLWFGRIVESEHQWVVCG